MKPSMLARAAMDSMQSGGGEGMETGGAPAASTDPKIVAAKKFARAIGVDESKADAIASAFSALMAECGPAESADEYESADESGE